uniref:Uncharacterized protein n=1 Tax=Romanomermis culicivorax TaxID=13658 RepID=A0A915HE08_ROMCU
MVRNNDGVTFTANVVMNEQRNKKMKSWVKSLKCLFVKQLVHQTIRHRLKNDRIKSIRNK